MDSPPHAFQSHGPGAAFLEQGHRVAQVALDGSLISDAHFVGLGRRIVPATGHKAVFTAVALRGMGGGGDHGTGGAKAAARAGGYRELLFIRRLHFGPVMWCGGAYEKRFCYIRPQVDTTLTPLLWPCDVSYPKTFQRVVCGRKGSGQRQAAVAGQPPLPPHHPQASVSSKQTLSLFSGKLVRRLELENRCHNLATRL